MNRNKRSSSEQGFEAKVNVKSFFKENNANGIAHATPFLDYYIPMKENKKRFQKHARMYEYLNAGFSIVSFIEETRNQRTGQPYIWVEIELPKGKLEVSLFPYSSELAAFLRNYQELKAFVDFTLEDLIKEAERIESTSESTSHASPNQTLTGKGEVTIDSASDRSEEDLDQ